MADQTPDEREDERPAASPRRAGLERLRAARGAAAEPAAPVRDTTPTTESASSTSATGRTAVLEGDARTGAERAGTAASTGVRSDDEPGTAAEGPKAARRRRQKERKAAGTVAATSAGRGLRRPSRGVGTDPTGPVTTRQAVAALVLALLAVGLLVPALIFRDHLIGTSKQEKSVKALVAKRDDALGFARRFTVTFFSPDYKTIDAYNDQIAAMSTGDFNKDFVSKRADLKSLLTKVQSQATGTILAAGVSKVSGPDAEVLVVADQNVKTTVSQGKTVTNRYRVRVSLHQTDKGWLVTNFEPVT